MTSLAEYISAGVCRTHIDKNFPLEEAAKASSNLKEGHPRGKVVIEIREKVTGGPRR